MDTTAKVDLRKLQLLNDRIAQVIDALNQVRFSVHGLQHTSGNFVGQVPMTAPFAAQMNSPYGWNSMSQWGVPAVNQIPFMGAVGGLNHTSVAPWGVAGQVPFVPGVGVGVGQVPFVPGVGQVPVLNTVGGLNHTDVT